ncbi:hypothetical protein F4859DRAFT_517181 [Xylaria cf. heliscus]|nr:hypothetical protein F4859DRAFT_517181 [Xylaria cf. heliscus]
MPAKEEEVPGPGPQEKHEEHGEREEPEKETSNYDDYTQDFPASNIDTRKLRGILSAKFGLGGYDLWMMQNRFYIKAPRELTKFSRGSRAILSNADAGSYSAISPFPVN